jgi:hypothetical protein
MTEYVVLLPDDESVWDNGTEEDHAAVYATDAEFGRLLAERGHRITGGRELGHTSRTRVVRRRGNRVVVTEGPYTEAVEQLSGFYFVESGDLDDLTEIAKVLLRSHAAVEIRPCVKD